MEPTNLESWIQCKSCNAILVAGPAQIIGYFEIFPVAPPCPGCSTPMDWWKTIVEALERNFFFTKALELAGAQSTVFSETLKRDSPLEVDFGAAGIPANAKILSVNITPQGFLFPAEIRQNYFNHDYIPHKHTFYPTILPTTSNGHTPPDEVELSILVTWYCKPGALESEYLFDAIHKYAVETRTDQLTQSSPQWSRVIVPANQALELMIGHFVSDALKKHSFRAKGFNYASELNPILPMVAKLLAVPMLPKHIAEAVDKLRSIRNKIIHEGAPKVPLTRHQTAKLLASALFTFHYIVWVRGRTGI